MTSVSELLECAACGGSGAYLDKVSTCPFCSGLGRMTQKERDAYHNWFNALSAQDKQRIKNKETPVWYKI